MGSLGLRPPTARGRVTVVMVMVGIGIGLALGWTYLGTETPPRGSGRDSSTNVTAGAPLFATLPSSRATGGDSEPVPGFPAPDFALMQLGGGEVRLSDYRGRPVLINFWASWCPPCRIEMPELVKSYESHRDEGFVIFGVNLTHLDTLPDVEAFVEEFHISFPVLLDERGLVAERLYRLRGLPMSVFVNRAGVVVRIHYGALSQGQLEEYVREILVSAVPESGGNRHV